MIGEVHQETQEINQGILEGLLQISDLVVVAQGTHVVNVVHQALHLMDDFQGLPILHSSNGHLTKGDLLQEGHQVRYVTSKNAKCIYLTLFPFSFARKVQFDSVLLCHQQLVDMWVVSFAIKMLLFFLALLLTIVSTNLE